MIAAAWFARATPSDLEVLAGALASGRIARVAPTVTAVMGAGLHDAHAVVEAIKTLPVETTAAVWGLRLLADERAKALRREAAMAQLVWSGGSAGPSTLRDTREVLNDLLALAEHDVLLATYVIYNGATSLRALTDRMRERPELRVELYVHLHEEDDGSPGDAAAWIDHFARTHWLSDVALPTVFYRPEAKGAMHAKCVVVDRRWVFVTSANFTDAAQRKNLEVGVVLDHAPLAEGLQQQFGRLRDTGHFVPMR